MNRPKLAPDLLGALEQAEQTLAETMRKLQHGEAVNGWTGMLKAKHILAEARAREEKKEGAAA